MPLLKYLFFLLLHFVSMLSMEEINYKDLFLNYMDRKIELLQKEINIIYKADNAVIDFLKEKEPTIINKLQNDYNIGYLRYHIYSYGLKQYFNCLYSHNFNTKKQNINDYNKIIDIFDNYFEDIRSNSLIAHNIHWLHPSLNIISNDRYLNFSVNEYIGYTKNKDTITDFANSVGHNEATCRKNFIQKEYYKIATDEKWKVVLNIFHKDIENIKNEYDKLHKETEGQSSSYVKEKEEKIFFDFKFNPHLIRLLSGSDDCKAHYETLKEIFKEIYDSNTKAFKNQLKVNEKFKIMLQNIINQLEKISLKDFFQKSNNAYYTKYKNDALFNNNPIAFFVLLLNEIACAKHCMRNILDFVDIKNNSEEITDYTFEEDIYEDIFQWMTDFVYGENKKIIYENLETEDIFLPYINQIIKNYSTKIKNSENIVIDIDEYRNSFMEQFSKDYPIKKRIKTMENFLYLMQSNSILSFALRKTLIINYKALYSYINNIAKNT